MAVEGALSYPEWLRWKMANPMMDCGPDVIDDRPWYQHLPWLNPYAGLEAQLRETERAARQVGREAQHEAEAG